VELGAKPVAPIRAEVFLQALYPAKNSIRLVVGAGSMGEDEAKHCGFTFAIVGERKKDTIAEDTRKTAKKMVKQGVDLLVFCGGDGTARDILQAVGHRASSVGCPNGRQDAQRPFLP
jgi:predicted polyphosphate/ATP-dependent NAD kinase